ncbi:Cell division protein FtsQ [bacterium HR29]|jgi:cell division protein FtsQ|nr:Cell division protein FtsQ [bacterium HR29]
MIVRRQGGPNRSWPRRIVRRTRPAVGQRRPRAIVRRTPTEPPSNPPSPRALPRWAAAAAATVAAAALAWGGWWLWHSPLVEIADVEVVGARRLSPETIADRSGLRGENIFTVDLAAAQDAILTLPLVGAVRVERAWPRGVRILIEERAPWGTWEQAGFRYTIDREGVVLGTMPPPEGALVIRSSQPGTLRVGDRVDPEAVQAAAALADLLPGKLGVRVAEVAFEAGKGVVVTTAEGTRAYFGDSSGLDYKVAVWAAVAREAAERGIQYSVIDLRFGNRPVVQ